MTSLEMVREFHEKFGLPIAEKPGAPSVDRVDLRLNLISEEYCELLAAAGCRAGLEMVRYWIQWAIGLRDTGAFDLIETADALGDLRYVVDGSAIEAGIPLDRVSAAIHESNLSKLGNDGKPILREDGKVLKNPDTYREPDIRRAIFGEGEG